MDQRITEFVETIRRRNIRETVAAFLVVALFGLRLVQDPAAGLATVGNAVVVLGALWVVAVIWWKLHIPAAEVRDFPPAAHPERWNEHLVRQAGMLRLAWLWYVAPLMAGLVIGIVGRRGALTAFGVVELAILAVFAAGVGALNVSAARAVERDRQSWLPGVN